MKTMHQFLAALVLTLFSAVAMAQNGPDMLTILTSDEDETQAMALILTMQAQKNGANPQILLCDDAGDLAVTSEVGESETLRGPDASPAQMIQGLINNGVQVDVCAIYLPNREFTEADLIEGVGVAQPPAIGALVADPDVRRFTF
ncbi:hypothetical protein [Spiribacter vilamensis]|uniref:Putative peroxiredoxin n=1 Tax=Spiribacter vilamensis TaxID=531306 RepID=A0A4Q8D231_9GAMM|nr:hypothetical protein [Spiribacter vilamensis]RZU99384.1 putative peroxiredoxin [Spiribacter vilamensis]